MRYDTQDLYDLYYGPGTAKKPTPSQIRAFAAFVKAGSTKAAAHMLGVSEHTVNNHKTGLYSALGAEGALDALEKLGWLKLPDDDSELICGWVGFCSHRKGHGDEHGEFRSLGFRTTDEVDFPEMEKA